MVKKHQHSNGSENLFLEIVILLAKVLFEFIKSFIKLFIRGELKDISQETVLITGTGNGIGKELAIQYAKFGCKVVCIELNEANNKKTVQQIKKTGQGKVFGYQCDVTDRSSILKLANKIHKEVGPVSVIVNNAGIMPCHPLSEASEEEIRKVFDVNLMAHFWVIEGFLPHLIERGAGHIIGISSMVGLMAVKNLVTYCGSKFAVRGILEALQEELKADPKTSKINCTSIHPYMVDTELLKNPVIRFPSLMGLIKPADAAASIIDAHRRNLRECTVPRIWYYLVNIMRMMPYNAVVLMKDFLKTGMDSD